MNSSGESKPASAHSPLDEDSAVILLHHLNEERGKLFTETDHREMRNAILDELAHGARIRPFTVFTFGIIILGLIGLLAVGLVTAKSNAAGDQLLTIVSTLALIATFYFVWSLVRGVREEAKRSLDERLAELEELRRHNLISPEEFTEIQAHILIAKQQSRGR